MAGLFSFALLLAIAIFLHVNYFSGQNKPSVPTAIDVFPYEGEPIMEIGDDSFINSDQNEPVASIAANIPPYKGDPIAEIGDDPFIDKVPDAYREKYTKRLLELENSLTQNPANEEEWLEVGLLKKFFNNYEGARDAWEYAKIVNPRFSTPYYNLGGLYAAYLKDNPKAEENYRKAIELDPASPYLYLGLADLYSIFYSEKSDQVSQVLLDGLANTPDKINFNLRLAIYYRDLGDKAKAIAYYKKVLVDDPENKLIEEEIERLSR